MTTKTIKTLLIALTSTFLLAGCDPVESLPQNYDKTIVVNADGSDPEIYNNIMGEIWTAINTGKADKTLEEFMKIVSKDKFGTWEELNAAAASAKSEDKALAKEYIKKHEAIFVRESDESLAEKYQTTVEAIQIDRLVFFYEDVLKRVNEVYYNEIKSGSYSKDNIFYEERLAWAHYSDLYNIDIDKDDWTESYITPEFTKDDVGSMLHLADGRYDDYTTRKILPQILKDKLVEEYLYNNYYATLGRAYARKVNIIKLTRDDKYKAVPRAMMEKYVETRVEGATLGDALNFEELANAWRGFSGLTKDGFIADPENPEVKAADSTTTCNTLSDVEIVIAEAAGAELDTAVIVGKDGQETQTIRYYKNTKLGILLDKYNIAKSIDQSNRWLSSQQTEALNEFTGSNDHTIEYGLRTKLADLAVTDYTTDGWYVKNGGLTTELPESLRNRLFNIVTANNVDSVLPEDAEHPFKRGNYVRNIKGNYLLLPAKYDNEAVYNYVVYDSGSYYLVNVLEAPSTSKMNLDGDNSYAKHHTDKSEALFTEKIAMEIAKVLGTKDSYINYAFASYLEGYAIQYHDTSVYDYFKSKFPELFED